MAALLTSISSRSVEGVATRIAAAKAARRRYEGSMTTTEYAPAPLAAPFRRDEPRP